MIKKHLSITVLLVVLLLSTLSISFMVMSPDSDEIIAAGAKTTIRFEQTEINLGTIKQGTPKEVTFKLTNTGKAPLVIYDVETSCGCTCKFRSKTDRHSVLKRTVIPDEPGHPFCFKADTYSG